jgi:hypothetical protein
VNGRHVGHSGVPLSARLHQYPDHVFLAPGRKRYAGKKRRDA